MGSPPVARGYAGWEDIKKMIKRRADKKGYTIGGKDYVSVTTVLSLLSKPALVYWSAKLVCEWIQQNCQPMFPTNNNNPKVKPAGYIVSTEDLASAKRKWRDVTEEALDVGSRVHHLIEEFLKNGSFEFDEDEPEEVIAGMAAFTEWYVDNKIHLLYAEQTICSHKYIFAGTCDLICWKDHPKKLWLIDFKTSRGFYDEMGYQLAAYAKAINEMRKNGDIKLPRNIQKVGILRLDKTTGKPHFKEYQNINTNFRIFRNLRQVYKDINGL